MAEQGKVIETVDLSQDLQTELHKVVQLTKRATVFLSYARQDTSIAERICQALLKHDYRVWSEADLMAGTNWASGVSSAIDEAVKHGFVLLLLSEASLKSDWCRKETEYALARVSKSSRSNVVPVIIEQFNHAMLPLQLRHIMYFDLTTGPFEDRVEELICNLKKREME